MAEVTAELDPQSNVVLESASPAAIKGATLLAAGKYSVLRALLAIALMILLMLSESPRSKVLENVCPSGR